jgi:hypothetical protein
MRENGCVMPRRPTHGTNSSSSRAGLPAPNITVARLEQERELASAPSAYFNEAQAEQALWQEFRDHGALLINALNEALQIHVGPVWQILRYVLSSSNSRFFLVAFAPVRSLTLPSPASRSPLTGD